MKLTVVVVIASILVMGARASTTTTTGSVAMYIARDRDTDRTPSVGDEARWIVFSATDATVTFTCWPTSDKTTQTFAFTTGRLTGNEIAGYGTLSGTNLTVPGYCESRGSTMDGKPFGFHWFPIIP